MKYFGSAVLVTVGLLAFGATTASAAVVCNDEGDCWRTKAKYTYPPDAGVRVYADDWKWGPNDKYRWREHEGRDMGSQRRLDRVFRELSRLPLT